MRKTIRFGLSADEIQRAIDEVEKFRAEFLKKVDTYRKRISEEIAGQAQLNFGNAVMEDVAATVINGVKINGGSPRKPVVEVTPDDRGNISVVVAKGEDAVWCEFGAGVYHNGSVGSSPNPYGNALGFTIGSYGQGKGRQQVWGYWKDKSNKVAIITRGTPASMPMYNAAMEVLRKSVEIAREVFNS